MNLLFLMKLGSNIHTIHILLAHIIIFYLIHV